MKNRNQSIEALRGILMLWIVLFHYTVRLFQLYPNNEGIYPLRFENGGVVGVTFFFVISGFYLFQGVVNSSCINIAEQVKFCINKYWRLYPAYLISVIIIYSIVRIYGLPNREIPPPAFVLNIFFIYHPHIDYVDSAHWFISDLMKITVLSSFFLLSKQIYRDRCVIFFELIIMSIVLGNQYLNVPIIEKFYYALSAGNFLKVLLGYNLLMIVHSNKKYVSIVNIIIAVSLLLWYCFTISMEWILFYGVIIFLAFRYEFVCSNIIFEKLLLIIGKYSFTWYLVHQNIGFIIINFLIAKNLTDEFLLIIPMTLTFFLAVLIQAIVSRLPYKLFS